MPHIETQLYRNRLVSEIEHQLGRALSSHVREALLQVPRHLFVDQYYQQRGQSLTWDLVDAPVLEEMYCDQALVTKIDGRGMPTSSSSQPSLMALQLEALDLHQGQRVLEIGTGTGYNAALIGHLVGTGGQVISIDIDSQLVRTARWHLERAGSSNVLVLEGDGYEGNALHAPYDRLLATCGIRTIPPWLPQLTQGGILVGNVLLDLASIFVRLEKVSTTRLQGQLLPIEGRQYMEMQKPGSLPASKCGTRWKKYDVLPYHDVECNLMDLLDDTAYSVLLQCLLPTVRKHYRWEAENEQPDLYFRISDDDTAAVKIQSDRIRVYGHNEQVETRIKQSITTFEQLGRPHLDRYHVVISEKQATIAIDDQVFSLPI